MFSTSALIGLGLIVTGTFGLMVCAIRGLTEAKRWEKAFKRSSKAHARHLVAEYRRAHPNSTLWSEGNGPRGR